MNGFELEVLVRERRLQVERQAERYGRLESLRAEFSRAARERAGSERRRTVGWFGRWISAVVAILRRPAGGRVRVPLAEGPDRA